MAQIKFLEAFDSTVCEGDSISCEVDGFTTTATIYRDEDSTPPWKREDGHGPVTGWVNRDKRPGERVLNEDRSSKRFYDFAAAVEIAKRDGWDSEPYGQGTPGERAARAAEADFARLKAWCDDEWTYVGVAVTVEKAGVRLTGKYDHACWGIESDAGDYLREVAEEYAEEAMEAARAKLRELCGGEG